MTANPATLPGYTPVIHDATRLGVVHLTARNLPRLITFYRDRIGLRVHRETPDFAALGAGGVVLGLALRGIFEDVFSGITLNLDRVADWQVPTRPIGDEEREARQDNVTDQ